LRQYIPGYLAWQEKTAARKAQTAARVNRERGEAEKEAYKQARREQAEALFATLPHEEQEAILAAAQTCAARFSGSLRNSMTHFHKVKLTAERYGDRLPSFEQWRSAKTS